MSEIESEKKTRNSYLDFVKGTAILLVLWGHCIQYGMAGAGDFFENPMFKVIYSFHMPLFMLVSGYLFYYSVNKRTLRELIRSKIYSLGVPILVWGCIPKLVSVIISFIKGEQIISAWNIIKAVYNVIFGGVTSIWFLWAVLVISIVMSFAEKIRMGGGRTRSLLFVAALIVGAAVIFILPGRTSNLYMYPYFILGCYSHHVALEECKHIKCCKILCVVIFLLMLIFYNKDCYIYTTGLWNGESYISGYRQLIIDVYRYLIGLFGSVTMLIFLKKIYQCCTANKGLNNVKDYIVSFGKISLQIYVLQRYIIEMFGYKVIIYIVSHLGMNIFTENLIVYDLILTPAAAVIVAVIIEKIICIINKSSISTVLFGR